MQNSPGRSGPAESATAFPRRVRLLKPGEFKRVFQDACRVNGGQILVLARANDLGYPRLGMAISRKNAKRAVARNRAKRQIRESFRLNQGEIGGFDVVVLSRPGIDRLDKSRLRATLEQLWRALPERCRNSSSP
ncbi:ribonuclease P protein component [Thiohalomonas denitrificans]|uniref:ribonuclease P protein component n=1 Tax=Thiohalomonas denitrificans TaxID=415747 RepID=UPI0026F14E56|nr:ribonuclease P protein component [Thiohalomonas denitrificans]